MNTSSILRLIRVARHAPMLASNVSGQVHVLLLEVPQLLREVLEYSIQAVGGCKVMTEASMGSDSAAAPDVVILGLSRDRDATLVPALFARWPRARILTIACDGSDATTYELTMNWRTLGSLGAVQLVDVLRRAPRKRRQPGGRIQ